MDSDSLLLLIALMALLLAVVSVCLVIPMLSAERRSLETSGWLSSILIAVAATSLCLAITCGISAF